MPFTRRVKSAIAAIALAVPAALGILTATPPSHATPVPTTVRHLTTRVDVLESKLKIAQRHKKWYEAKIKKLHYRIDHPNTPTHTTSSSSSSSASTSSTSSYSGGVLSDAQVLSYLRGAGFPESALSTMLYYAHRESGNNPRAINASSGACGLWQLYPCVGGSAWLDPATNAHYAFLKYQASGFAPWGG